MPPVWGHMTGMPMPMSIPQQHGVQGGGPQQGAGASPAPAAAVQPHNHRNMQAFATTHSPGMAEGIYNRASFVLNNNQAHAKTAAYAQVQKEPVTGTVPASTQSQQPSTLPKQDSVGVMRQSTVAEPQQCDIISQIRKTQEECDA